MNASLDGHKSLAQQTLSVIAAENSGYLFLSVMPDLEKSPFNNAVFRPLTATEPLPSALTFASGALPSGKTATWMSVLFADGKLTPAIAYRN
jgi:hypothetical protein